MQTIRSVLPLVISCVLLQHAAATEPSVAIVTDASPGPAATHGVEKLIAVLAEKNVPCKKVHALAEAEGALILVAGLSKGDGPAARLLAAAQVTAPQAPESLVVRKLAWHSKPAWTLAGADDRGLMYAALDAADRVGWAEDRGQPFSELREATESPAVRERALSLYTMNRAYWESRFYDEAYWARYLDLLAQNRFNSFVVIFGYENGGFLAPPYPYFFDVDGFDEVRMIGITRAQQERNLRALRRLIAMTHARGMSFTVGIWDHIYRGGVQGGGVPGANETVGRPVPGLVSGVTEKNLTRYTQAALARFLHLVPDIDAIQFRMHDESGLKNREQADFWRHAFAVMKAEVPHVRFDARAKGLPDAVIETALDMGVPLRITTKYWMEQMGMPFHPTHVNRENQHDRRHSYADLLRYPQHYQMLWRLWNGGTSRVLLWGDPDYARRFAESTHLYNGDGFEVNEPLATKMEAQPHDEPPFALLAPQYRYYDWEFERYWHFFQVFGRLGYDPHTPAEVWQREFVRRFGKEAAPYLERGLHRASGVLPRIVAACYPYGYFPMTRGWAEKQPLGDLPSYAKAEGSDIEQFASFDEEARNQLEGRETAKTRSQDTSRWFAAAADDILAQVAEAEKRIAGHDSKEFHSTQVDLTMLAGLARFHARRIPAAVSYCLYRRTKDAAQLDAAIAGERAAIEAWRQLVAAAGDVYAADLKFGARRADLCGHWRDELAFLEKELAALVRDRNSLPLAAAQVVAKNLAVPPASAAKFVIIHQPIAAALPDRPLTIAAEVRSPAGIKWVRLRYRSVTQYEDYRTLPMLPVGAKDHYQAVVAAEHVVAKWDFMYFIEIMDNQGHGRIYPDLNETAPYIVVRLH